MLKWTSSGTDSYCLNNRNTLRLAIAVLLDVYLESLRNYSKNSDILWTAITINPLAIASVCQIE
jgi:hypothetical protein